MEKTGANEAYVALIKRVLEQGDTKDAEKAANDLLKKSTKAGMTQTREAALQILLAAKPEAATKNLLSALKDTDKGYRNAALNFASGFADQVYRGHETHVKGEAGSQGRYLELDRP